MGEKPLSIDEAPVRAATMGGVDTPPPGVAATAMSGASATGGSAAVGGSGSDAGGGAGVAAEGEPIPGLDVKLGSNPVKK